MKKVFLFLILVIFLVLGFLGMKFQERENYNLILKIDSKQSLKKSLSKLPKANTFLFKLYLKYKNGGRDIKAGYYEIDGKYNIKELVSILEEGKSKMFKFTIIEGSTVKNVIDNLSSQKKGNEKEFYRALSEINFPYPTPDKNFEGYLYPETYLIPEKSSEKYILEVFLREFLKKFPEEKYPDKKEFYQKLILASIIEREAAVEKEKPLMASVFYNRIKKNMPLGADSTINFIFNYEKKRILYRDLEVDSPYNTYKNKGLPPAPIANPTLSSVEATYKPAESNYLFFVTKGGGEHFFSKTYGEHIRFQNEQLKKNK